MFRTIETCYPCERKEEKQKEFNEFRQKKGTSTQKREISKVCKDVLSDDDMELVESVLATQVPVSKKKANAKKKPAAAKAVAKQKAGKGKAKKTKTRDDSAPKKTTFRHRATSNAYNQAKSRALQQGLSRDEALAAGRSASRKVAEDIDAGLLKDPDAS